MATAPSSPPSGAATPARQPVRMELHGGDRLTGVLLEETEDAVLLRTRFGAEVRIPRAEITRLDRDFSSEEKSDRSDPSQEEDEKEDIAITGELELGAAVVSSAKDRRDYLSKLDVTFQRGADHLRFNGLIDIQKAGRLTLRNRQAASVSLQKELMDSGFMTLSARYLRDPTAALRRRTSASIQFGRIVLDDDLHSLTLRAGPGFAEEHRTNDEEWSTPLIGWGIDYELALSGVWERFSFRHRQEGSLDPRGSPLRVLLESETGLRYRVTDNLYLSLTGSLELDSLSSGASSTFDRRLQLRMGYGW